MSEVVIPNGWCVATIMDVATSSGGGTPSKSDSSYWTDGTLPWVSPKDMKVFLITSSEDQVTTKALERLTLIPENSVLVVVRSGILSRTLPVAINQIPVTVNQDMRAFVPETGVDSRYIAWQLISRERDILDSCAKDGTTVASIEGPALAVYPWAIAPPAEQTRIVEKLEELLSDLDAGVAELKAAQRKLAQYRQSLLKAAVEGITSSNATGYPTVALGELVESIGQGWSPRCDREPAVDDDEWAVIKTTAIQPLSFDGSHNKRLPSNLDPREHLELEVGDLLVTRAGPRSRVGITCLVRATRPRLILCDKAYRIRCHEARINPGFLELVLNAPHVVSEIDRIKSGISDSGLNLTQDRFFTLMIPLPTIAEQSELIDRLAVQTQSIADQEQAIELALKQAAAQRKNILKAAFAGQLVPQDPNDEPASGLLERIRTERATQAAEKKPRQRQRKEAP